MSNKIQYGLKSVYYAPITNVAGVITYASPVSIPGAVNLTLSPAGDKTEFYADDIAYYTANSNNGYEGSLEIALIPDSFRIDVLKETIDDNGAYIENGNAVPIDFALMFEFNGDAEAIRHILYNVNASRPNIDGSTKTASIEPKTGTLNITAKPAIDTSNVKAKLKPADTGYTTFFSAVYLEDAPTNTVASATASFSKVAPADLVINASTTGTGVLVKDVKFNGASIGGANMSYTDVDPTIKKEYIGALTNGVYVITVEFTKGNAVTVTLTVAA